MNNLKDKFSKNAEEFDVLMIEMLSENDRLKKQPAPSKILDELREKIKFISAKKYDSEEGPLISINTVLYIINELKQEYE